MKNESMTVKTEAAAWKTAAEIFGCEYQRDTTASNNAGYPIYRGVSDAQCWISDLGSRLELNMADGSTITIWIEPEEKRYTAAEVRELVRTTKNELAAVEEVIEAMKNMDITETTDMVMASMAARKNTLMAKLAEFGL